ncbi:MAG TPA: thiamine phosphate synthase [Terriglobia bacterium]|nr:thiamine phosphate synthase [Terriglobia bacterium]
MIRCYVTDRRHGDLLPYVSAAIRNGVDIIQIREKDLDARALYELTCRIRDAAAGTPTKVLVNDRLDIALAANLDGVHLPANGLPASRVRPLVRLLGCSTHTLAEALQAERDGADFAIFGPIFETPGKAPVGLDALKQVTSAVRIPVLAIGGITLENSREVLDAGAAGIAAIRLFQKS